MPGRPSALSEQEALEGLREATASRPVATTPEVAEQCDVTPPTVSDRLEELEAAGEVDTHLAGRTRIWWVADAGRADAHAAEDESQEKETEQSQPPTDPNSSDGGFLDDILPSLTSAALVASVVFFVLDLAPIAVGMTAFAGAALIEQTKTPSREEGASGGVYDAPGWFLKSIVIIAALAIVFFGLYIHGAVILAGIAEIVIFVVAAVVVWKAGAKQQLGKVARNNLIEIFYISWCGTVVVAWAVGLLPREAVEVAAVLFILSVGSLLVTTGKIALRAWSDADKDAEPVPENA
jgi:hypothetical protein